MGQPDFSAGKQRRRESKQPYSIGSVMYYLRCLRCQRCLSQALGRCDSNESFNYVLPEVAGPGEMCCNESFKYVLPEVSAVSEVLESGPGEM